MLNVCRGFGEDAEEDDSESTEQLTSPWHRDETAYYYKDPKKALRNWLEVIFYNQ